MDLPAAAAAAAPTAETVARALRVLATQTKASKAFYQRNRERIRARSLQYWQDHRDALNLRRREKARLAKAPAEQEQATQ